VHRSPGDGRGAGYWNNQPRRHAVGLRREPGDCVIYSTGKVNDALGNPPGKFSGKAQRYHGVYHGPALLVTVQLGLGLD